MFALKYVKECKVTLRIAKKQINIDKAGFITLLN